MNNAEQIINHFISDITTFEDPETLIRILSPQNSQLSKDFPITGPVKYHCTFSNGVLSIDCDFDNSEKSQEIFDLLIRNIQQFYYDQRKYNLVTLFRLQKNETEDITVTVDKFTPFPYYRSFRVSCRDITFSSVSKNIIEKVTIDKFSTLETPI